MASSDEEDHFDDLEDEEDEEEESEDDEDSDDDPAVGSSAAVARAAAMRGGKTGAKGSRRGESVSGGSALGSAKVFLAKLREEIKASPYNVELHVALLTALRRNADLERLNIARRDAAAKVALAEDTWLEWLQDDRRMASGAAELGELEALHECACRACPTAKVWLARVEMLRESGGDGEDPNKMDDKLIERIRAVFEESLSALGLHPSHGPKLWQAFLDFERELLRVSPSASGPGVPEKRQVDRVRRLYLRHLAVPLPGLNRVRQEHAAFEQGLPGGLRSAEAIKSADAAAATASIDWRVREEAEGRLADASRPSVSVGWVDVGEDREKIAAEAADELLQLEESSGDRARVSMWHFRMTQLAPKDVSRWRRYSDFLLAGGEPQKAAEVLDRAVRHLPTSGDLWLELHSAHEACALAAKGGDASGAAVGAAAGAATRAALREVLERGALALQDDFNVAQSLRWQHADACRRSAGRAAAESKEAGEAWEEMRSTFESAVAEASKVDGGAYSSQTLLRWMRLEAYAARDWKATIKVGDRLVETWGSYYNVWSAFIAAVQNVSAFAKFDMLASLRDLFERAMAQVADYPGQMRNDFLQFERECGTFDSLREAQAKIRKKHEAEEKLAAAAAAAAAAKAEAKATKAAATAEAAEPAEGRGEGAGGGAGGGKKVGKTRGKGKSKEGKGEKKGKNGKGKGDKNEQSEKQQDANRYASSEAEEGKAQVEKAKMTEEAAVEYRRSSAVQAKQPPPAKKPRIDEVVVPADAAPKAKPEPAADSTAQDKSAAPPGEKATAAAPAKTSAQSPAKLAAAMQALAKPVQEEEEESAASQPHKGSHYHQRRLLETGADPIAIAPLPTPESEGERTIYIAGLDWSVDEPHLRRIFGEVDGLKDVRLVKDFLGRSKGFAYIDFQSKEQVIEAVSKFNGHEINKRPMKVAPSKPTKALFEERVIFVKNIGASAVEADVTPAFTKFGKVVSIRMPSASGDAEENEGSSAPPKQHKGYAYVEFETQEAVESAVASNEEISLGKQVVIVARSIPMKDHRHHTAASRKDMSQRSNQRVVLDAKQQREDPVEQSSQHTTTVFVKNLAFDVADEDLRNHFGSCGKVEQVLICRNGCGRSRGFGFVEFAAPDEAQSALLLSDSMLKDREIVVSRSQRAISQKKDRDEVGEKGKGKDKGKGKGKQKGQGKGKDQAAADSATSSGDQASAEGGAGGGARAGAKRRLNLDVPKPAPEPPLAEEKTDRADSEPPPKKASKADRVPFRALKTVLAAVAVAKEADKAAPAPAAPASSPLEGSPAAVADKGKSMSNADFRALILSGGGGAKK